VLLNVQNVERQQVEMKNFAMNVGNPSTLHVLNVVKDGGLCSNTDIVRVADIA
jgi:hypothetical protein